MPVAAITLTKLTKTYGTSRGVENIDLSVKKGQVFGFLGPNGAGKTTTIRLMLDFIRPTGGQARIFGLNSQQDAVNIHKRVGYLSGEMALDNRLTGRQYLEYMASLRGGVPWSIIQKLVDRLECELDRKIGNLSRGNRQKVGLVAALMHDPDLLILDEPTSGLDPLMQAEFNKLLLEHRDRGKTAFISSHVLSEVQETCDHVGFISEGKLLAVQSLQDLMSQTFKNVRIVLGRNIRPGTLTALKNVNNVSVRGKTVTCTVQGDFTPLVRALGKYTVKDLSVEAPDLDDLFMRYYQKEAGSV